MYPNWGTCGCFYHQQLRLIHEIKINFGECKSRIIGRKKAYFVKTYTGSYPSLRVGGSSTQNLLLY